MPDYSVIRIDRTGHVAEVVLDNPDRLNTMAPIFFEEIGTAFRELDKDPDARAIVLWAEGKLFTAGLDLKAAAGNLVAGDENVSKGASAISFFQLVREWQDSFSAIEQCSKPVVAAIHGHCIGGGVDLCTAADIRLCSSDATFSIMETRIAMVADLGTLQRLTPIVGKGFAREMAYTGKRVSAERAHHFGLVNDVLDSKDELLAAARALAGEIAANSPIAVQGVKQVLQYSEEHSIQEGLDFVAHWNTSRIQTHDLMEAITAFMEKREPEFKGQ
jgi:enoyl-CoA hydratase